MGKKVGMEEIKIVDEEAGEKGFYAKLFKLCDSVSLSV